MTVSLDDNRRTTAPDARLRRGTVVTAPGLATLINSPAGIAPVTVESATSLKRMESPLAPTRTTVARSTGRPAESGFTSADQSGALLTKSAQVAPHASDDTALATT